ncbi:MAG: hypothetical protein R2730_09445 [Chitinophagales bacterium]
MNKLALITTALLLSLTIFAQGYRDHDKSTPEEKAAYQKEYLTIVLDLTDDQVGQLEELQKMHQKKVQAIQETYKPTMDEMKAKMKEIKDDPEFSEEKAKAIKDSYKEKLAPMHDAMKDQKAAFDKELVKILDDAQGKKYMKLQALKESKHKGPKQGRNSLDMEKGKPAPTQKPAPSRGSSY